ncbi:MAG: hypothetical protein AB1458_08890 [Bacteroidota bacterium]
MRLREGSMHDSDKYEKALRIMNDEFAGEYYDDKIKETLSRKGISINDEEEQRILTQRIRKSGS